MIAIYFVLIVLIIISVILFLWQTSNLISIIYGSLYVKTNAGLINFALKKADLKNGDIFYDLGCGNGDVLIAAVKMGAKVIGYEISPFYYLLSKMKTAHKLKVQVKFQNIKEVDLSKADVVYCYLLPKLLGELTNKFLKDKPKTVISIGFEIRRLPNKKLFHHKNHKIFIYSLRSRST